MGLELPPKPGDRFRIKGQVFEFMGQRSKRQGSLQYLFRSKTHEYRVGPLRFLNNLYSGDIKPIKKK